MKQESGFGWSEENRRKKPKQRLAVGGAWVEHSCAGEHGEARQVVSCAYGLAEGVSGSPCVMLPNQAVTPVTTLAHSSAGTCFSPF